jgi:hypothetical protein
MKHIKKFNEGYLSQYNASPIEINDAFEEVLSAIATLEVSLEKSEFKQGVHDPKKGIEVQRTKEEFIKNIEDIAQEVNSLKSEYIGALGRGGVTNVVGPSFVSQKRSY